MDPLIPGTLVFDTKKIRHHLDFHYAVVLSDEFWNLLLPAPNPRSGVKLYQPIGSRFRVADQEDLVELLPLFGEKAQGDRVDFACKVFHRGNPYFPAWEKITDLHLRYETLATLTGDQQARLMEVPYPEVARSSVPDAVTRGFFEYFKKFPVNRRFLEIPATF